MVVDMGYEMPDGDDEDDEEDEGVNGKDEVCVSVCVCV